MTSLGHVHGGLAMTPDRAGVEFLLRLSGAFHTDDGAVSVWNFNHLAVHSVADGPVCPNRTVPRLRIEITTLVHAHSSLLIAYLALLVGLGFGLLAVHAPRSVLLRLGVLLVAVFGQAAVGTVQFFTGVPAALVAVHVAGAAICTAATAALWASMRERTQPQPVQS